MEYLEECGLASLSHGVDSVCVEASRRRDGSVVIDPVPAVHRPVVVAVVVDVSVPVVHQAVLAHLLRQGAVGALQQQTNEMSVFQGLDRNWGIVSSVLPLP